jgi:hypothetical protein
MWLQWNVEKNFWESEDNQRKFLDWIATEAKFTSYEDWYYIDPEQINSRGGLASNIIHHHV